MPKTEKLVLTKQFFEAAKEWNKTLGSGENLCVLFPPLSDCQRRIDQFIQEHSDKYLFLEINPLDTGIEELTDLENSLLFQSKRIIEFKDLTSLDSLISALRKKGQRLVITCILADFLFTPKGRNYLSLFQKMVFQYAPDVVCLLSFETDVTHPNQVDLVRYYNILFQHIAYYPLYSLTDSLIFINYLCQKWNLDLKEKVKLEIVKKCGGYFWLIKEALRQIRDSGSWSVNSETFKYRLQTIAESFNESEYTTITRILTKSRGLDATQTHSREYLTKIGMLNQKNELTSPLLNDEIIKLGSSKRKLILEKNEIFLNQVPVTKYFSRKELRVIKLFLSREGETVTRDEIANVIWPMEVDEKFSEWAIDQLINRLRKRLSELLIPKTVLRSVRGKGYCYVQS